LTTTTTINPSLSSAALTNHSSTSCVKLVRNELTRANLVRHELEVVNYELDLDT